MLVLFARTLKCLLAFYLLMASSAALAFPKIAKDPALQRCIETIALKRGWHTPGDITNLKCHKQNIRNLDGIHALKNLTELSLFNNKIEVVDPTLLTAMPNLTLLNLAKNNLSKLELSDVASLSKLYVFSNRLEELKLFGLPWLSLVKANGNKLLVFEYEDLPRLSKIYIFDNKLEHVNIHQLPSMEYMDARQNPMPDELYDEMDALSRATILHDGNADDW